MKEQIVTKTHPVIRVESCRGDLSVRGWSEAILQIKGDHELQETEKGFVLSSNSDLRLTVPEEAMLFLGRVEGDLSLKKVPGVIVIEEIHGDAALVGVGELEIAHIHGDLSARQINGSLAVEEAHGDVMLNTVDAVTMRAVYGDLSARGVNGSCTIDLVSGDANLRGIGGDLIVGQGNRDVNLMGVSGQVKVTGVQGDIRLRGGLGQGEHRLEAKGDIIVRWPPAAPLAIIATGKQINNHLALTSVTQEDGRLTGHIGEGDCRLTVNAGGRIILKEQDMNGDGLWVGVYDDMGGGIGIDMANVAARVESEMNNHLARLSRDLESRFGADFGQRINEKLARKSEKAAEHSRRRADVRGRAVGADFAATSTGPTQKTSSMEEQLKILKMVETGKITSEEAGMLLEALDS
ncbi:MAG TPA: hypothetical protein PKE20_00575 [Promineifilum sp.]|nr:hypothetical protein [Promineifilum sp.]